MIRKLLPCENLGDMTLEMRQLVSGSGLSHASHLRAEGAPQREFFEDAQATVGGRCLFRVVQ
jgi:hypothetical protein